MLKFTLLKLTKLQTEIIFVCLLRKLKINKRKCWLKFFSWSDKYAPMLIPRRLMRCQRRLSFPLPLPTSSSSTPSSKLLATIDLKSVAMYEIGHLLGLEHSSMAVALDQYALGAIVVSIFALVVVIYSFVAAKKKVVGEVRTKAVNCIAATTAPANGECRSANVADADVIIVGAGIAGSALTGS